MSTSTRQMSPYIAFCYAKRDEVKAANPDASFGDMGRLLAALWKEQNENKKAMYTEPRTDTTRECVVATSNEPELRRSSRLRNKRLGLNFWGLKEKK